jgi:hypothetical protein
MPGRVCASIALVADVGAVERGAMASPNVSPAILAFNAA